MPPILRAKLVAAAALFVPWLSAPMIVTAVVERNARSGLYGATDSIILPIASAVMLCAVGCIYLGLLLWRVAARLGQAPHQPSIIHPLSLMLALLATAPAIVVLLFVCSYWWSSEHAPIVVAYSIPMLWVAWATVMLAGRKQRSPEP